MDKPQHSRPSVGYFPDTFPRDPILVNQFMEHVLLGQILEPLVQTNSQGFTVPALASEWEVSASGLFMKFKLRQGVRFSDGRALHAKDVVYSLKRHIDSTRSQSRAFLKVIQSVEADDSSTVGINLNRPYLAILKALSRDHLGIVPEGWEFDPSAREPLIGTGAYRAVKGPEGWLLVRNPLHWDLAGTEIEEWALEVLPAGVTSAGPLPDLLPFVTNASLEWIEALARSSGHKKEPVQHNLQQSAWWYPHGANFKDTRLKQWMMAAIQALIGVRQKAIGLTAATGAIPKGIAGYLTDCPITPIPKTHPTGEVLPIRLAVMKTEMPSLVGDDGAAAREIERAMQVHFDFIPVMPADLPDLPSLKIDALFVGYAGAFSDPEGFITVVSSFLASDLGTILQAERLQYEQAASETDWTRRAELYRQLNHSLVTSRSVVPAWRANACRFRSKRLAAPEVVRTYTPRLKDYSLLKTES